MSDKDESYLDAASRIWKDAKREYPKATLAASFAPVTGEAAAALEFNDAWNRGDKGDMALATAGMVPAGKLLTAGAKATRAGQAAKGAAQITAAVAPGSARAAATTKVERWPDVDSRSSDDYAAEWNR